MFKKCEWCLIEFETKEFKRKFCSQSCSAKKTNTGKLKKVRNDCLNCGLKLISYRANNFCNNKCQQIYMVQKRIEESEKGVTQASHQTYRNFLIQKNGAKCMKCGWAEINPVTGKVPIEMNHIDGKHANTILSNLELLCPNCHFLTPNYKALNKGNGREYRNG